MRYLLLIFCLLSTFANAQTPHQTADYAAAARFAPKKVERLVFSTSVDPHWLKDGNRFWYRYENTEGRRWYIVDASRGEKRLLFDNAKLAAQLTRVVRDPMDAQHLTIDSLKFVREEKFLQFEVLSTEEVEVKDTTARKDSAARKSPPKKERKKYFFELNLANGDLVQLTDYKKPKRRPTWASISPDGQWVLFMRKFNLFRMDKANYEKALQNEDDSTIRETAITTDGTENFEYGFSGNETNVEREKNKNKRKSSSVLWSPDSKRFAILRTDNRGVKDLWVVNSIAEPRPTLETYKYHMPGEKEAPITYAYVFDAATWSRRELPITQYKDQAVQIWPAPSKPSSRDDDYRPSVWLGSPDALFFQRTSRDLKRIDLCRVDVTSGAITPLITESLNTYVETRRPGLVNGGREIVQWSERDGWAHFYLHDEKGNLKTQLTSGSFHCEDIVGIDEKERVLYFTANGRESGEDPYYLHLYRVRLDGSDLRLINRGAAEHDLSESDGLRYFVDNSSTVSTAPQTVLLDRDGRKILSLETTDLRSLQSSGYRFPEAFTVKADDGVTDLYGVMYKPFKFDSTRKYPVIAYVYPGPQTEAVNKAFGRSMDRVDRLAQLGFVVITVGNRGGHPSRSKWYHNYGYGNLRDYGIADKKAAIEQLADRHPYIDLSRVGIHGHSGGGFMSTAAVLVYPDFFKVAVSSAGNHDNAIYNRWWSEKHHGVKEVVGEKGDTSFVYSIEKNPELAKNLKGKLLLFHGDIDNNVHPANTIRMANALIRANKRFDMVLLPGQRHGFGDMTEYFFWRMADYFSTHLLGDSRGAAITDIEEMNRELPQSGRRAEQRQ